MGHSKEKTHYFHPGGEEKFAAHLDNAIAFHETNKNDPHNIGNAVICALLETRNALAKAYNLPPPGKARTS